MPVAAILYDAGAGPQTDALIVELAQRLKCAGLRLAGAVQSNVAIDGQSAILRKRGELREFLEIAGDKPVNDYRQLDGVNQL